MILARCLTPIRGSSAACHGSTLRLACRRLLLPRLLARRQYNSRCCRSGLVRLAWHGFTIVATGSVPSFSVLWPTSASTRRCCFLRSECSAGFAAKGWDAVKPATGSVDEDEFLENRQPVHEDCPAGGHVKGATA